MLVAGYAVEAEPPSQFLARDFFARDTVDVARELLGVWLVRSTPDGLSGGPIVETEAYGGPEDGASHARAGRTPRTTPMFGEVGRAYVYLVYGMHSCINVVAYDAARAGAGAVLIRALDPRLGLDGADARVCSGPAKLTRALGITRAQDGHDLTGASDLWLAAADGVAEADVSSGPRIGVAYAGPGWVDRPWRFWITASPSVSRAR